MITLLMQHGADPSLFDGEGRQHTKMKATQL